jgi:hypothetical protein
MTNKWDKQHLRNLGLTERQIERIYDAAVGEAAAIGASLHDFDPDKPFSFDDYPKTKARIDRLIKKLQNKTQVAIVNGVRSGWTLANNKNSALSDFVFGKNKGRLTKTQERRYYSNNDKALEAFLQRKTDGLNLSDRVWDYADRFKAEIETGIDLGLRDGLSSAEMARDLKMYLKDPDRWYRRFKLKDGVDREGQPVRRRIWKRRIFDEETQSYKWTNANPKDYNPGRGVYRSSCKNALRLSRTETNMAYHTADYLRWQQLDFVVGIEVRLSNNHTLNGKAFTDICDDLAGKYPKDFKFTGWHPQCRCYAIPVLKTEEEMSRDNERIMNGEMPDESSANTVKDVPDNFTKWIGDNRTRIEHAKSLPYFIRDNSVYINNIPITSSATETIREAAKQDLAAKEIKAISPPTPGFHVYKELGNGGRIEIMDDYVRNSDYRDLITIAREYALKGKNVKMVTPVHYKDPLYSQIFGDLEGTVYERKCPDLIIGELFYEYEGFKPPFKKEKVSKMISHGAKQSNRIIIKNTKGSSDRYIRQNIIKRLHDKSFNYKIEEVWLYEKGKIRRIW